MKSAYFVMRTKVDENGNYIPCIAVEGETGYYRTSWQWGNDWELANELCDEKNEKLGLTKKEAALIQLRSMRIR